MARKAKGLSDAAAFVQNGPGEERGKAKVVLEKDNVETKALNTRVPVELIRRIKVYCAMNDMTVQGFIIEAAAERLERG